MKKIIFLAFGMAALSVNAQQLKLSAGQKIISDTRVDMELDMGMGGQMKVKSKTTNVLEITGVDDAGFKGTATVTKMSVSQEGMGQSTEFDSEKKGDLDSEMGKMMGKEINKSVDVIVDKKTGKAKEANPKKDIEVDSNPMANMMGGMGEKSAAGMASSAFFIIPQGKKAGDKWTDSLSEDGMKGLRNYELKAIDKDEATVIMKTTSKGSITKEVQGMQMEINMNTASESNLRTNITTGLVKKNSTSSTMEGTLDMMGQSMPISMKMTTELEVD